jgi:hypothetical protein
LGEQEIAGRVSRERLQRADERCCGVQQNRVVLAPVAGVKSAEVFASPTGRDKTFNPPMTVTRRIRRRGERGISRKAIARGMPECLRLYLYARVRFLMCILHARPRVQRAPGIPCALFRARDFSTTRAHRAAGSRNCVCNLESRHCEEHLRRSNPFFLCAARWIASLRSQ